MSINLYQPTSDDALDRAELALYHAIMAYRASQGLPSVPLSKTLTITAGRHALDTIENIGGWVIGPPGSNSAHGWSDAPYDGRDPSTYNNMWFAPERLGTGFTGYGFEISALNTNLSSPTDFVELWASSPGHNAVMLNAGVWSDYPWQAVGIGIHGAVAHVWFSDSPDPLGPPALVDSDDPAVPSSYFIGSPGGRTYSTPAIIGPDALGFMSGTAASGVPIVIDPQIGAFGEINISDQGEAEPLVLSTGNDIFTLSAGNQSVDGAGGADTAITETSSRNVSITADKTGVTIVDRNGTGGTDRLINFETLQFADVTLGLGVFDSALTLSTPQFLDLMEMYVAYFNRAADASGLYFWADMYANGLSLEEIAEFFFDQAETRALYPNSNDTATFVTEVYANVLGRTPDAAGFSFWKDALLDGFVTPGRFVLEIIRGANAETGDVADAAYLSAKADLGLYFSVIRGLSDVDNATQVMEIFGNQSVSNFIGAQAVIDTHYANATAPEAGELTISLVGFDDEFFADI